MPTSSRSTVRQIAADTGVSIATVSRVLNGHTNVAPDTRAMVEAAIAARGPAVLAPRRGPAGRTGPVFVRCPYVLSDYFGLIVSSVTETLRMHERDVLLDAGESSQDRHPLASLSARAVAGAILILPPESPSELLGLRRRGLPFVIIDPRTAPPPDVAAVSAAHVTAAMRLTTHLLELGHRRIGVIAGPQDWLAGSDRLAGHQAAMGGAGILTDPELTRVVPPTLLQGEEAAGELLDLPRRPTALVCFNDKIAVGAMAAARARGLRTPQDVSITGFDDIDVSRATTPQLTTVRQPLEEMGRTAVTLLNRLINQEKVEALHMELATELVVRGSTGEAPPTP
ncbi:LacI family DNA-binding transcriptional regulator [Cellulomonas sp. URHD0024]|uniref:LacI family DNA-binding transcriptional regulator n=1 Tax=Cellulomonas sp. URHD0024 TaxID=1302620 RepID=UPI000419CB94|nr:LacI family DNA-binding transcriptional regulator [Cellulomonas sp. URHD0024]